MDLAILHEVQFCLAAMLNQGGPSANQMALVGKPVNSYMWQGDDDDLDSVWCTSVSS